MAQKRESFQILLLSLAFSLYSIVALSQGWTWKNPLPQKNNTFSTWFTDTNTGFLVGNYGTLMRTKNGGNTWEFYNCGTSVNFRDVTFSGNLTGYVAGEGGMLLKTTDGGNTWFQVQCSNDDDIYSSICFVTPDIGYVASVYGSVYKTTDGGISWISKKLGNSLYCVRFIDADHGIITGNYNNPVYHTTNGGLTWDTIQGNVNLLGCAYANADIALASGDVMKRSIDGGVTWTTVTNGPAGMRSIYFTDELTGYAAGSQGRIYKTTDSGLSWQLQQQNSSQQLYSVHVVGQTGFATGAGTILHALYKTNNGGDTWESLSSTKTVTYLSDLELSDTNTVYAVGYSRILKSTDQGENWSVIDSTNEDANISVDFTNNTTGYIAGYGFEVDSLTGFIINKGFIKKTTNSGQTWEKLTTGESVPLSCIKFFTENIGVAIGYEPSGEGNVYILRTNDAGNSWILNIPPDISIVNNVFFLDQFNGYAVGGTMDYNGLHGNILKTSDGGLTWSNTYVPYMLEDVYFINDTLGYAGGALSFMKTVNSGKDWVIIPQNEPLRTYSLFFLNTDTGFSAGMQGRVYKTLDGGNTWTKQWSKTIEDLNAIKFVNESTGFIAGNGGVLLKTTDGGGIPIGVKDIPLIALKVKAYPNPVADLLTIETIPDCEISVYSMSGQLLLNQRSLGRNTQIDFTKLPAGMYIIRQRSDNNIAISKIIKE